MLSILHMILLIILGLFAGLIFLVFYVYPMIGIIYEWNNNFWKEVIKHVKKEGLTIKDVIEVFIKSILLVIISITPLFNLWVCENVYNCKFYEKLEKILNYKIINPKNKEEKNNEKN